MGNVFLYGNGGGGGTGGTLTVTAPAGVAISVEKDGKIKTKTVGSDGLAVFKGLKTGTWTLTITDGEQVSTKPVVITADYSTVIAFFSATINIVYPAGSTCTCSDGVTTLTAPDTSGSWSCVVPNKGTWTVSCTDNIESTSGTISITADGQHESISLMYWNGQLYERGNQFEKMTGGWVVYPNDRTDTASFDSDSIHFINGSAGQVAIFTKSKINVSDFKTLKIQINTFKGGIKFGLTAANNTANPSFTKYLNTDSGSSGTVFQVDLSSTTGEYYVSIVSTYVDYYVYKIWLE